MNTNKFIVSLFVLGAVSVAHAQDVYEDDIYYNPKKDKSAQTQTKKKRQSNYIADFSSVDVDAYNMQGGLLQMPADTIGLRAENGEDFVYTQQIQKYYNPTIVLDNAELLADVLNNSYGNVDIVINDNGIVGFAPYSYAWPYYSYGYGWPYNPGWGWGASWGGWGWNIGLGYYDPWYAWGWGSSWGWPGGWRPGWGPGWTWGPSWYPSYGHYADYTPRGNRRVGAGGGWASSTRPGGNYGGHRVSGDRYGLPGYQTSSGSSSGNRRQYNTSTSVNNSRPASGNRRGGYTVGTGGHRTSGSGRVTNNTTNGRRNYNTTTNKSYNTNNTYNRNNNRTYNSTTTNRNYNSGGSYRGGGGGGGRGRHR